MRGYVKKRPKMEKVEHFKGRQIFEYLCLIALGTNES